MPECIGDCVADPELGWQRFDLALERSGLTLKELAERSGLTVPTLRALQRRKRQIRKNTAWLLGQTLQVSMFWLVGFPDATEEPFVIPPAPQYAEPLPTGKIYQLATAESAQSATAEIPQSPTSQSRKLPPIIPTPTRRLSVADAPF